ncbi:MAG: FtsX-like permease family protein [Candidatus Thorarchaeota archaeon]
MAIVLPKRNVTRNHWRTFLIIIGIALSVGLETGIAISIDSLYSDFIDSHRGDNFTDITIHPKDKTTIEVMRNLAEIVKKIPGVETVSPVATINYIDELSVLKDIPQNIILYGLEPEFHPDFSSLTLISGNATLHPGQAIISQSIANVLHVDPGQIYSLPPSSEYDFKGADTTISGIMKDDSHFGNYVGFLFVLLDLDYMLDSFTNMSHLNFHLTIKADNFLNINSLAERIEDTKGLGLDFYVFREKSISEIDVLGIRSYQIAMNLIIIASFVVEFLFITNILTINIKERSKEFGILRAVGTSNKQIATFLGMEILIYSGIGSLIGNLIGFFFSVVFVFLLNINFPSLSIETLIIQPTSIATTFITGVLIALIAGLYPILVAISLPVVQNIHWRMRRKKATTKNWIIFIIFGTLLTIIGFTTTYFIGPSSFLTFELISWHFFVVFSVFLGTFLLEIGLLNFLPNLGMKLMFWHKVVPRTIATRNIRRESQKSIITIMVAALALTFILVVGIISSAIIETIPKYYDEHYAKVDIIAETADNVEVPPSFEKELVSNNTDIEKAAFIQQKRTTIGNVEGYVFGMVPESMNYFFGEMILLPNDPDVPTLLTERGAIISNFLRDRIGVRIGENLTIQISSNSSIEVTITGVTVGNPFLQSGFYIFVSHLMFQEFWQNRTASWFLMAASKEVSSLKTIVDSLVMKYPSFQEVIAVDFYTKVIERSLIIQTAFFQILFLHTFLLSGLAQFICILISTLKMEREIGIMRAMGLSKGEVLSTFFGESTLLGITGTVTGLINGIIGGELMAWYISQSIPIKTNVSGSLILFWAAVAFLITVTSTIIPSYRSSTKNIANAINMYVPRQMKMTPLVWPGWDKMIDKYLEERNQKLEPEFTPPKDKKL